MKIIINPNLNIMFVDRGDGISLTKDISNCKTESGTCYEIELDDPYFEEATQFLKKQSSLKKENNEQNMRFDIDKSREILFKEIAREK